MKKVVMFLVMFLTVLSGLSSLHAQSTPRFFVDRLVEVQGYSPRQGDLAREERRETALLRLVKNSVGTLPVDLAHSLALSPRKNEKLWVFYDSACQGSVEVSGLKAQKLNGKIPALGWFHFENASLPVSINGNRLWNERAVYIEAESSEKMPPSSAATTEIQPVILPEYSSQQLFTRMLVGLKTPPPDWQIKRWMTQWNYGKSFSDPALGIECLELKYKYPTKETNQEVLCRVGDQLRVWNRLPRNRIEQAFQWAGKYYLVLTQTGRGITWTDLYRLDAGTLTWITGHRLPEDPLLDDGDPLFLFQQNNRGYIAD
jgi:hypothetical protein